MAGVGYQEVLLVAALAYCIVPIAAVVFAVPFFREKRRADGLEAMLREGGWTHSGGTVIPRPVAPPAASLPVPGSRPSDPSLRP